MIVVIFGYFDKTTLYILTVLISGIGIIGSRYCKYEPPQTLLSFLGENPYLIKKQIIDATISKYFTFLALGGLTVQLFRVFWDIPDKIYAAKIYFGFFLVGCFIMYFLMLVMKNLGRHVARKKWLPKIISNQKESFETAEYIVAHDGWRKDQWDKRNDLNNKEFYREANFKTATECIVRVEELLEKQSSTDDMKVRIKNLKSFFNV